MKNFVFVLLALFPHLLKAQFDEWMPIRPLTDSSHNNRNAFLERVASNALLFWDQELNQTTTQLCYKYINYTVGDMNVLFVKPGVRLTNPKAGYYTQGTGLKIFYQTNEGKDIDLKYVTLKDDGSISDPEILSDLPGNDINLTISEYGMAAWENNGKIWVSQYLYESKSFSIPFTVDSAGVYSPVFSSNFLTYLKQNGDSTFVTSVRLDYYQGNWTFNNVEISSLLGECSELAATEPWGSKLCMKNKIGVNNPGLIIFDNGSSGFQYMSSPSYSYSQPAICLYLQLTKSQAPGFLAYVSDSLAQNEIFAESPTWQNPGLQNISQWPGDDRNPQFFSSFPMSYYMSVNLIWESERQGFSTIYFTQYNYLLGGTKEEQKNEPFSVNPCPFNHETTIRFHAADDTKVRILDLKGQEIKTLIAQKDTDGWQKAIWDGTNNNGSEVPAGSYIIVCCTGNSTKSRIIIKNQRF